MFYSNFYTPFPYAFYPYSVYPFNRPTGYVLKQGEIDSWWGNYPLGNPPKVPKYLGWGQSPISGPLVPLSLRRY